MRRRWFLSVFIHFLNVHTAWTELQRVTEFTGFILSLFRLEVSVNDSQAVQVVQSQCQLGQVELHVLLCEHHLRGDKRPRVEGRKRRRGRNKRREKKEGKGDGRGRRGRRGRGKKKRTKKRKKKRKRSIQKLKNKRKRKNQGEKRRRMRRSRTSLESLVKRSPPLRKSRIR